jgi:protein-tyrosine-phosphatase
MSEPKKARHPLVEGVATITRPLRQGARAGIHRIERLLHPGRRRRALELLRTVPPGGSVLFICLGNICRSPYAEFRLRALAPDLGARVSSAGFILPGRPSPENAVKVAKERGLDMTDHRSRVISPLMLGEFDLVVAMTAEQVRDLRTKHGCRGVIHLGDVDPGPIPMRDIPDPYGTGTARFAEVYERIDRAVGELHRVLRGPRST